MHFSTLFFSVLLPFSLALPRTKTVSSTDGFFVSNFRAFASTEAGRDSTVSFVAYAGDYEFGFLCKVPIKGSLYSDMMWYACDRLMSSAKTDEMSFQIVKDFPEMRIKRTWSSDDGMVVTGFAAQPTNWDESEGGNATSGDHGKTYERMEPWEFTYDSFMG